MYPVNHEQLEKAWGFEYCCPQLGHPQKACLSVDGGLKSREKDMFEMYPDVTVCRHNLMHCIRSL